MAWSAPAPDEHDVDASPPRLTASQLKAANGCLFFELRLAGRYRCVRQPAQFARTRWGGKDISTSVPSFGVDWITKFARLASVIALVSGRPRPVPSPRLCVLAPTWRNGFIA